MSYQNPYLLLSHVKVRNTVPAPFNYFFIYYFKSSEREVVENTLRFWEGLEGGQQYGWCSPLNLLLSLTPIMWSRRKN